MITEALKHLAEQANQAAKATIDDRGHYHLLHHTDGTVTYRTPPQDPRDHVCHNLDALAALIDELGIGDARTSVWVGHDAIVAVVHDDAFHGRATFPLTCSRQRHILETTAAEPKDQTAFCRMLRLDLDLPADMVAPFRRLTFSAGRHTDAQTKHAKESLGREVYAELANAADVPEELTLALPLYDCNGQRKPVSIRCNVDIDTQRETLRLCTAPGAIATALDARALENRSTLAETVGEEARVYLGTPTA